MFLMLTSAGLWNELLLLFSNVFLYVLFLCWLMKSMFWLTWGWVDRNQGKLFLEKAIKKCSFDWWIRKWMDKDGWEDMLMWRNVIKRRKVIQNESKKEGVSYGGHWSREIDEKSLLRNWDRDNQRFLVKTDEVSSSNKRLRRGKIVG